MDLKQNARNLVKQLIFSWGIKEEDAKDKMQEDLWWFYQGSALFHIQLFDFPKGPENKSAIEVGAIIMKLPTDPQKRMLLFERALAMNSTAVDVWFAVRGENLILMNARELEGLDFSELKTIVDDVRLYADYFDDIFKEEYGK